MTKNKRMWFISVSAALLIATAFGASAARRTVPAASATVVAQLPLPALDRLVTRLAGEARALERR
jgi:hypothetical protein